MSSNTKVLLCEVHPPSNITVHCCLKKQTKWNARQTKDIISVDNHSFSVNVAFCKLFFNRVLVNPAVWHVKTKVSPFLAPCGPSTVWDGNSVTHSKVHSLHYSLTLQFSTRPDRHSGHVTAGANKLLAIIVALLHVLQAPPNRHPKLLRDFQGPKILRYRKWALLLCWYKHVTIEYHW